VYSNGAECIGHQLVGTSETRSTDETANIYSNPEIRAIIMCILV